ncbi:hypothetical protein V6O07_18355, partial [Arthrospira platensis SPKY2]
MAADDNQYFARLEWSHLDLLVLVTSPFADGETEVTAEKATPSGTNAGKREDSADGNSGHGEGGECQTCQKSNGNTHSSTDTNVVNHL